MRVRLRDRSQRGVAENDRTGGKRGEVRKEEREAGLRRWRLLDLDTAREGVYGGAGGSVCLSTRGRAPALELRDA